MMLAAMFVYQVNVVQFIEFYTSCSHVRSLSTGNMLGSSNHTIRISGKMDELLSFLFLFISHLTFFMSAICWFHFFRVIRK